MKQGTTRLFHLMGMVAWGDIGPFTMYKNKNGKVVVFLKTIPGKPASELQTHYRNRFAAGCILWQMLSPSERDDWNLATSRLSIPLTGHNLFLSFILRPDDQALATINRQSGIDLANPHYDRSHKWRPPGPPPWRGGPPPWARDKK